MIKYKVMKRYLRELIEEYNKVKAMSEEQVINEYDEPKEVVLVNYENDIDYLENKEKEENIGMVYDVDESFNSWLSVNSMFV